MYQATATANQPPQLLQGFPCMGRCYTHMGSEACSVPPWYTSAVASASGAWWERVVCQRILTFREWVQEERMKLIGLAQLEAVMRFNQTSASLGIEGSVTFLRNSCLSCIVALWIRTLLHWNSCSVTEAPVLSTPQSTQLLLLSLWERSLSSFAFASCAYTASSLL